MSRIEAERALLEKQGIYAHFGEIIKKVIDQKPEDPHKLVEIISRAIKEPLPGPAPLDQEALKAQAAYHTRVLDVTKAPTNDEGGTVDLCAIPNFQEESRVLEWAGVGFGEVESYKVMCSLRKLGASPVAAGFNKLRLWGKILGTDADYWVAEAQGDGGGEGGEGDEGEDKEAPGTGANAYKYYVTSDLCDEWKELPDIKPKEIVAARKVKKLFTGKLDAKVITHPHFPGNEAALLRAQIARITSDTVLCMNGYLKFGDEEDPENRDVAENPEFAAPAPEKLMELVGWTHMQPKILKHGRTTHVEVPEVGDEDEQEAKDERDRIVAMIEADPMPSPVRDLSEDGLKWSIKGVKSQKITYVQSLTWPGAVCVSKGTTFVNMYVGHGLVAHEPDFFFCAPLDVQEEPEDPGDEPEPQGEEEEPKVEEEGG